MKFEGPSATLDWPNRRTLPAATGLNQDASDALVCPASKFDLNTKKLQQSSVLPIVFFKNILSFEIEINENYANFYDEFV